MMHGHEKSDPAIVAKKPTNKAGQPASEPVERSAGAKLMTPLILRWHRTFVRRGVGRRASGRTAR
jgi:hypothetical protein